jgi:hypothetical protein
MDRELGTDPNAAIPPRACGCLRCACAPCLIGGAVCPVLCCCFPCRSSCCPPAHAAWSWPFEAAVAALRSAGQNLPRSIGTLRLLTDPPLGAVPTWLGPAGVGVAANTLAPAGGEWFWPAAEPRRSCWCCCSAYPGHPEQPLEAAAVAAVAAADTNRLVDPTASGGGGGGGGGSGCGSGSGHRVRRLNVAGHKRVVLYFHGGAFALCSSKTHRHLLMSLASATGACVLCPNYRRPPEHPWPLPVDDCLAAYVF